MNTRNKNESLNQAPNANLKECWWMLGGVVDYKLCDRDYDCEHCPFDQVLHGRLASSVFHSPASSTAGPGERDWARRVRKNKNEATSIQGCEAAGALFYHPAHTWARIEDGGCVRTGLDDFGQRILGRPYLITLPELGATLHFGEGCWQFTHQAGVSTLVAPISGRVKEVNHALAERPALLNRDPYGEGWALLIEPTDLKGCLKRLLYGPKVMQWYEREFERLYAFVSELSSRSHPAGPTMNDGGWLSRDFTKSLSADQLRQVIDYFFPLSPGEKAETSKAIMVKDRR